MTGTLSEAIAEMSLNAKTIEGAGTGYDQNQRLSFLRTWTNPIRSDILSNKEADCSSFCFAVALMAGYKIDTSDYMWTGTLERRFVETGDFVSIPFVSLDQLQEGDFILHALRHVEYVIKVNGKLQFVSARIDERGKASGGEAGDQSGREVRYSNPYIYSAGWQKIIRPISAPDSDSEVVVKPVTPPKEESFLPLKLDGDFAHRSITELERALIPGGYYKGIVEEDHGRQAVFGPLLAEAYQEFLQDEKVYTQAIDGRRRECDGDFAYWSTRGEQLFLYRHRDSEGRMYTRKHDGKRQYYTMRGAQRALNRGIIG